MMPHMSASKVLTVIVEQCLAPVPGGTGRYAEEITAALAASPPDGWRVRTVTAWHRDRCDAVIAGADGPHRLPAGHRVLNQLWRRGLPPWVRGTAVHATTPLAPGRLRNAVVTVHDAASHHLAWLGGVFGTRVVPVGVDEFGQSGSIPDLYGVFDLLPEQIVNAALVAIA